MEIAQVRLPNEVPISNSPIGGFEVPYPPGFKTEFTTKEGVGKIISNFLPYALILGGIILLIMLLMGGFEILFSLGNQEAMAKGMARIKNALLGFFLLFGLYWIAQIIQVLFKIQIL